MLYIQYIYSHDILLISQNWLQNSKNIYLEKDISYIWKIHNGARWVGKVHNVIVKFTGFLEN